MLTVTLWTLYKNTVHQLHQETSSKVLLQWHQPSKKSSASWWLNQPIWKICSSNWIISPRFGMQIKKSLKFHHLGCFLVQNPSCPWDGKALMRRGKRSLQIAIMCFCTQYVCSQFYRLFQFFFTFVLRILFVSQYLLPNICSSHSFLPNIFFPFFFAQYFLPNIPICSKYLYYYVHPICLLPSAAAPEQRRFSKASANSSASMTPSRFTSCESFTNRYLGYDHWSSPKVRQLHSGKQT